MPDNIHKEKQHNQKTGYNMNEVNIKAFKYLFKHKENMKLPFNECKNIMKKNVNNFSKIL